MLIVDDDILNGFQRDVDDVVHIVKAFLSKSSTTGLF